MKNFVNIVSLCVIFFTNCNESDKKKDLPKDKMFLAFSYVDEIVDSTNNATINYKLMGFSNKKNENKILIEILNEYGWPYKITEDGQVFISLSALQDIENLFFLSNELKKRVTNR